jgi:hypothetical protein
MKRSVKASTNYQRLPRELINDIQRAKDTPVMGAILNKVVGPNVVWPLGPQSHARPVVQPKPTLLGLFLWNFQPLPSPNPLYHCPAVVCPQTTRGALMIYVPAAVIQHARDHTIAVSSEIFRQRDNILGQPFFIRQATWHLALRRTMLAECAANPALRYAEGLPHMINAQTATGRT